MSDSIEMILAIDSNNGIGKNGIIPWNIPDDMKFFREKTNGHIVFMGKNTFFSLPEKNRPLKNRYNVVYTREPSKYNDYVTKYDNLMFTDKFVDSDLPYKNKKIFIIGGSQIYNDFYSYSDIIWLTHIKNDYECDIKLDMDKILTNYIKTEIVKKTDEYIIEKWCKCI
jgi:dihydrofolate reductase